MAHNEENDDDDDDDDDDDQHVHSWNPNNPPHMPLPHLVNEAHHIQST
jgi:hypothetical protein